MITKALNIIRLLRPLNFGIIFISIFVAGVICSPADYDYYSIILAAISGALAGGAGNIINDYFDYEIDIVNKPRRPIPSGKISKSESLLIYLLMITASVIFSAFINPIAFSIVIASTVLIFFYSFKMKRVVLLGNFSVSLLTGLAFIYGGIAVGNIEESLIPAAFALMINFIREIVKDIEDIKGDSFNNVYTFPQLFGIKITIYLLTILILILMVFSVLPYFYDIYNIEYFIIIMTGVNVIFIYILNLLNGDVLPGNISRVSNLLKLNMVLGLAAIYIGIKF